MNHTFNKTKLVIVSNIARFYFISGLKEIDTYTKHVYKNIDFYGFNIENSEYRCTHS